MEIKSSLDQSKFKISKFDQLKCTNISSHLSKLDINQRRLDFHEGFSPIQHYQHSALLMLIFVETTIGPREGVKGISMWSISFQIETYKTETTMGDTVGLVLMPKLVKTLNRESQYSIWQSFS